MRLGFPAGLVIAASCMGIAAGCGGPIDGLVIPAHHEDAGAPSLVGEGGAGILGSGCATATAEASQRPAYLLIVLDGSGSMIEENKWTSVVPALDALFADLAASGDTSVGVGLTVFSDSNDPTRGNGPYTKMDVAIAAVDATQAYALTGRLSGQPSGLTPTFAVMSGQYPLLESFAPSAPLPPDGERVLALMTDGVPNGGAPEQQQVIALAQAEYAKGIPTFAVGIGDLSPVDPSVYDPLFMAQLAIAGGTANPGCDPMAEGDETRMCHFQVTPGGKSAAELEAAFAGAIDRIRGAIASCTFDLQKNGQPLDPAEVNVVFTSGSGEQTLVPQDATDGWTYDDPSDPNQVILHGQACGELKGDPHGRVQIVVGCRTVTQ
jgi:hypothetical protein